MSGLENTQVGSRTEEKINKSPIIDTKTEHFYSQFPSFLPK